MKWHLLWAGWLLYFVVVETWAYRSGGYWSTFTGHVMRVMQAHPLVAVFVLGVSAALTFHLLVDYVVLRK